MIIKENSVVGVDLDGTMCLGECFTEAACLKAKPRMDIIKKVNRLNREKYCFIIVHTARKEFLRNATDFWLKKYGVRYNALVMEKMWANVYIDDRAMNVEDFQ